MDSASSPINQINNDSQNSQNLDDFGKLQAKIAGNNLPADLAEKLETQLNRLKKMVDTSGYKIEFERELKYIEFVSSLPFNNLGQDILDLKRSTQLLDKHHYGLKPVKDRILEYLSVLILNSKQDKQFRAPILAFVGLVGSGKTSLSYSIAESLGRKIIRIPFGGLGSVRELRGESKVRAEAEPGFLIQSIAKLGVKNPVILLDEIDRVAEESRHDVMGVLVELLDPEQNNAFVDHYVDYPFDLSQVLFIATCNNISNIATAVLDRMELIEMPAYSDEEKIVIGREYVLPQALKEAGLKEGMVTISDNIWPQIVRPLGFDAGIRSLQRTIHQLTRKIARKVVEGNPGPYHLEANNISEYIQGGNYG